MNSSNDLLTTLTKKKNIDIQSFTPGSVKLEDDIALHAAWAFNHIYSVPYPSAKATEGIARVCHGIQHVSRAAMYIPVFANLYRRYEDKDALELTQDDIKLIQIAALFHDSAREGEEEDYWDHESGILLYHYLTQVLGVEEKKATLLAEAAANKDANNKFTGPYEKKKNYHRLKKDADGKLSWEMELISSQPKNIYQKLIHDADCLDIIRARNHFDAQYLDFYQEMAIKNYQAFDELAQFITEARSIIELQGDGRSRINYDVKKKYEHKDVYPEILKTIDQKQFCVLPKLYAKGSLLPTKDLQSSLLDTTTFDKEKDLTEENMRAALREGKVFARSIPTPSAIRKKESRPTETMAAVEIRKMQRRLGVPTRTLKENRTLKNGNPHRSVSLLGWGGTVYSSVGFLIVDPALSDINAVSAVDIDTGRNKKKDINSSYAYRTALGGQIKENLDKLIKTQKMGGSSRYHDREISTHTEIVYRVSQADAIFISQDANLFADYKLPSNSLILQAIFLQKEYENTTGKKLPIFNYSGIHNFVTKAPEYSNDDIKKLWVELCSNHVKDKLAKAYERYSRFDAASSIHELKTESMYSTVRGIEIKELAAADQNYNADLKNQINAAIEIERKKIIDEHLATLALKIKAGSLSCFAPEAMYFIQKFPTFFDAMKDEIKKEVNKYLNETSDLSAQANSALDFYSYHDDQPKIQKIVSLAKQLDMKEIDIVKNCLIKSVNEKINKLLEMKQLFESSSYYGCGGYRVVNYSYDNIKKLIKNIKAFNMMDILKDPIRKLIDKLHDDFVEDCISSFSGQKLDGYKELIDYIQMNMAVLEKQDIDKIKRLISFYGNQYANGEFPHEGTIENYLKLADICDISKAEKKHVLINLVNERQCAFK